MTISYPMAVGLVVFDIAGTTVEDPDGVGGCLKAALSADGIAWEADSVNAIMGIPKPMAIQQLMELAYVTPGASNESTRSTAISRLG